MKPRLLDLGCGAGAASVGYAEAGFEVTGVDIVAQPRYPFEFIQADALSFPLDGFSAYHASMPCQRWAQATLGQRRAGRVYPDLVTPLRPRLQATGRPWIMENVPQAPLRPAFALCGCMFGLRIDGVGELRRVRSFELSHQVPRPGQLPGHDHRLPAISICGHGTPAWQRRATGHIGVALWREVMGVSWTTREELAGAIPPAYTRFAGKLLRRAA